MEWIACEKMCKLQIMPQHKNMELYTICEHIRRKAWGYKEWMPCLMTC
jgi:hypothetical protein